MGLVSEGKEGMIIMRIARIWLFFQDDGKVRDEKEALMRAVRCNSIGGEESFSMAVDIWFGSLLLEYVELSA